MIRRPGNDHFDELILQNKGWGGGMVTLAPPVYASYYIFCHLITVFVQTF